jgi:hypothetical protein
MAETTFSEYSHDVEETFSRGHQYAKALLILDPRLSQIQEDDLAMGFDVGGGADAVAFVALGFKKARVTNQQPASYGYLLQGRAETEDKILNEILKNHLSGRVGFSNLGLSDWVQMKNFSPRLTTLLRMSPICFGEEDSASYLKEMIELHEKLKKNSTIVISALDDHTLSKQAFQETAGLLIKSGIEHELLLDADIPEPLKILGQRILTIKK